MSPPFKYTVWKKLRELAKLVGSKSDLPVGSTPAGSNVLRDIAEGGEVSVRYPPQSGWLDEWGCLKAVAQLV